MSHHQKSEKKLPIIAITANQKIRGLQDRLAACQDSDVDYPELSMKLFPENDAFWDNLKAKVLSTIENERFVIIRNMPFDPQNILLVGFLYHIGNPVLTFTHSTEQIVREVSPVKGKVLDPSLAHTDSTFWPEPNDITALLCVKKDQDGNGKSRIISINDMLEQLPQSLICRLKEKKYPFVLDHRFGAEGFQVLPILTVHEVNSGSDFQVRFNLSDTMSCLTKFGLSLSKEVIDDLVEFEKLATKIGSNGEFVLENGDLLLFDNRRTLHSRSRCEANSDRQMRMMKLNL